ncbi:MAG: L,D-transpeptidase, partial [Chloroflexota bacterium]
INMPSPDMSIPLDPVPNKRIVVNLSTQSMVAYENGQPVFSWLIASGMDRAPTSPGTYQIISHAETASGGSSELCSALGCAQWEMDWFMGIYEVIPGLINGFHGRVLLANGRYLGDGNTGRPLTYGCIMADNDNAKALYDWADEGTVVEILSPIYAPRSDLGRQMLAQAVPPPA